jgi:hypothetical protein
LAKQQSREKAAMKTKPLRHQTPIGKNADLLSAIASRYREDDVSGSHRPPILGRRSHKQQST